MPFTIDFSLNNLTQCGKIALLVGTSVAAFKLFCKQNPQLADPVTEKGFVLGGTSLTTFFAFVGSIKPETVDMLPTVTVFTTGLLTSCAYDYLFVKG
jgi:hypothetical protein